MAVRMPEDCEPLADLRPAQAPEASQETAFAADHRSVELVPLASELGLALRLTVGACGLTETVTDCAALPLTPVHVNV